jgi:fucose 4-O-acetylase-like acetyltransferase
MSTPLSRLKQGDRRSLNTLLSICLFVVLAVIAMKVKWDSDFSVVGIFFVTAFVAISLALLILLVRLCGNKISKSSFTYTYIGTLNLMLFLVTISLFFGGLAHTGLLLLSLIHLVLAILILVDIFSLEK